VGELAGNNTVKQPIQADPFSHVEHYKRVAINEQAKKKSFIKRVPGMFKKLTEKAFQLNFGKQGDKVSYDNWDAYPICMLG